MAVSEVEEVILTLFYYDDCDGLLRRRCWSFHFWFIVCWIRGGIDFRVFFSFCSDIEVPILTFEMIDLKQRLKEKTQGQRDELNPPHN